MPKLCRVMKVDGTKPMVGDRFGLLGVRKNKDIATDETGNVHPKTGGMSVSPSFAAIPFVLLPERLRRPGPARGLRGNNDMAVWTMGHGDFVDAQVADRLVLRAETAFHGLVEPEYMMTLETYSDALTNTRDEWKLDPEAEG